MSYPHQITSFDAYQSTYEKSVKDPEGFWAEVAENFEWKKKWDTVLKWNFEEPSV
jgi:acetyl-CoA synthetase